MGEQRGAYPHPVAQKEDTMNEEQRTLKAMREQSRDREMRELAYYLELSTDYDHYLIEEHVGMNDELVSLLVGYDDECEGSDAVEIPGNMAVCY